VITATAVQEGLRFQLMGALSATTNVAVATVGQAEALPEAPETPVRGLPVNAKIRFASCAPGGRTIMFVNSSDARNWPYKHKLAENAGFQRRPFHEIAGRPRISGRQFLLFRHNARADDS
jgi:hypothetical protein